MNVLAGSFFLCRVFHINVRIHFTLILMMIWRIQLVFEQTAYLSSGRMTVAVAVVVGLFVSILLHEFGHSLACKLFRGDADEILLWPLGGLAFCRPPHHPTAHLVTTVCGPLVTLLLWLGLQFAVFPLIPRVESAATVLVIVAMLAQWNLFLLVFNLLPGFPMDGGRIVRDILWHFIGFRPATVIAVWLGRATGAFLILWGLGALASFPLGFLTPYLGPSLILVALGVFVILQNLHVEAVIALDGAGESGYSLKEHVKQAKRRTEFKRKMAASSDEAFHSCRDCGITDQADSRMEFRIAADGEEYCAPCLAKRQGKAAD